MTRRFGRTDWLSLGLAALAKEGPEALTIDALCARATKTRGSFYHHFDSMEAYLAALGAYWRREHTEAIIEKAEAAPSPTDQREHLNTLAMALDPATEQGIRRLAGVNAQVAEICRAVDAMRTGYMAELYKRSGGFDGETAEALSWIEYAAFVGFQVIGSDADRGRFERAYLLFSELVDIAAERGKRG